MLDKIREIERLLEPEQNDYLSTLRERIHPIKGKASLGEYLDHSLGFRYHPKYGFKHGDNDGNGHYYNRLPYYYDRYGNDPSNFKGGGDGIGSVEEIFGYENGDGGIPT